MSLFCKHAYKRTHAEFAYSKWINEGSILVPAYYSTHVDMYIVTNKCLKCGKIKMEEVYTRSNNTTEYLT